MVTTRGSKKANLKLHNSIEDVGIADNPLEFEYMQNAFPGIGEQGRKKVLKYHPCWPIEWSLKSCSDEKKLCFNIISSEIHN